MVKMDGVIEQMLTDPNVIGEALRRLSFIDNYTYELKNNFQRVDDKLKHSRASKFKQHYDVIQKILGENYDVDDAPQVNSAFNDQDGIFVSYFHDGDTTLYFSWNGIEVINDDAKKDRNWKFIKDYNIYQ